MGSIVGVCKCWVLVRVCKCCVVLLVYAMYLVSLNIFSGPSFSIVGSF